MPSLDTPTQEQVLKQATMSTLNLGAWQRGIGVLTPQRLYRRTKGYSLLSFAKLRLINLFLPERVDIDIPLTSITTLGRGKIGLLKDVLSLKTIDGKTYQLAPGYEAWLQAIKQALEVHTHATLTPDGNEKWTVQR